MSTLQRQIAEKFLEKLSTSKDIDSEKIVQLKALLGTKKVKADSEKEARKCLAVRRDKPACGRG